MSGFVEKKDLEKTLMNLDNKLESIKGMVENRLNFAYSLSTLSVTLDGNWYEKTVASNAVAVILGLTWETDTLNHIMYFYTRKNGSSEDWEQAAWARNGSNTGDKVRYGTTIIQPLDLDGKYEYKGIKNSGTFIIKQVGYFYK